MYLLLQLTLAAAYPRPFWAVPMHRGSIDSDEPMAALLGDCLSVQGWPI